MSQPTASDQHINALLTDVSVAFVQDPGKFVATQVFPPVNVQKQTDIFPVYSRADFLRDEMELRGPGAPVARGGYTVDTSNVYNAQKRAFGKLVTDEDRANADAPFAPDRDAAIFLAQKALINLETNWTSKFFTTGIWTGSTTATDLVGGTDFTAWDDVASDVVDIIKTQRSEIESNTGVLPNTLVLNRRGWDGLENHPDIIDRVKHVSDGPVTEGIVARLLGIERIIIAAGVKNSGEEGGTAAYDYIAGNHALLVYAAPSPSLYLPSGGYTFRWTGLQGSTDGMVVKTVRRDELESDEHYITSAYDQKVVSAVVGAFFTNVVS